MTLFLFDPTRSTYDYIFKNLQLMREEFHQIGRFDDSNAKLDEILKLFATYLAYKRKQIDYFPKASEIINSDSLEKLNSCFLKAANHRIYTNQNGISIFGNEPSLMFREGDEKLAQLVVTLVRNAVDQALDHDNSHHPFDILSEAFGHFVRDNFRSNTEDAQYMTPPEVVDFMVNIAINDIVHSGSATREFLIADPTCGVGSFLTTFYHRQKKYHFFDNKNLRFIAQDKVERMTRITKINLELFETVNTEVYLGNSLDNVSSINQYNGKIDLILTNPPFGAKFTYDALRKYGKQNFPFFSDLDYFDSSIASELLFIDRNLSLLKKGGKLLIIVPDKVVSSGGHDALLRHYLKKNLLIKAVIELPPVTFAQAGTRTKTVILYLEKNSPNDNKQPVFVATCNNLGFEVKKRKGVPIKVSSGENELPSIQDSYFKLPKNEIDTPAVIHNDPSAVCLPYNQFINNSWTPNHYNAERIQTIKKLHKSNDYNLCNLSDLVCFPSESRPRKKYESGYLFIGVPHILGEGLIDYQGILQYEPITPGNVVYPGEIIFSKINPRIPRGLVVPDLGANLLCSSEFEVIKPTKQVDAYAILFLLLSPLVQKQIKNLTSGTSASHSRIKTKDLGALQIPIPKMGTATEKEFKELVKQYRQYVNNLITNTIFLSNIRIKKDFQ